MKVKTVICCLLLSWALAACHTPTREAKRMLRQAALLVDTMPDSTVRLVDSVMRMEAFLTDAQRMNMALLQAKALFKDTGIDGRDETQSVPTSLDLERAAEYFATKKQFDKAAEAALFNGYVQQEANNKTASMLSFKNAELFGKIALDSFTVAKAEYNIGQLLYFDNLEDEALSVLDSANQYFGHDYSNKALVQNAIATCCILLGDFDNAEQHIQLCLEYAHMGHSILTRIKALNNQAVLYREIGEYDKALSCLRQAKNIVDAENKPSVYLNMAKVFMNQKETDSAGLYLQYIENELLTDDVRDVTKASAYSTFSQFAESQGNYADAYRYRGIYDHLLFALMEEREQKSLFRIRQQFDYNTLRDSMNERLIHRQRIIILLSIVSALVLVAFSMSQVNLARIRKQEADIKDGLFAVMQQNQQLYQKSEESENARYDMVQKLDMYKNAYEDYARKLSDAWIKEQRTMQKLAVYLKEKDPALLDSLKYTVFGNHDYWESMTKAFDKHFPDVRESLIQQHCFSDNELKIVLLSYLDTSREDTALLLNISIHMVDKLRNSVRKKLRENHIENEIKA